MAIIAEITDGPQKGSSFQLFAGKTFGRVNADYVLRDGNVSSVHCKIDQDERGRLILIDLDSANGLVVNSRLVKKILLLPGVSFMLGSTTLKIKEISDAEAENLPVPRSWRSRLRRYFEKNKSNLVPVKQDILLFQPAIELEFILGLQAEKKLLLSYGPRAAGFGNLDIEIEDPDVPHVAFEILPQVDTSALFVNKSGFKVLLNNSPVDTANLKEGDLIQIGQSTLKVTFI